MTWEVLPGRFALLGFAELATPEDLAAIQSGAAPGQLTREGGETTLLLSAEGVGAALARHPSAACERGLAWIRFRASMEWTVVGFLARVCTRLAEAGVPVGAVCGYSRDSLFVAEAHLAATRTALAELYPEHVPTAGESAP